VVTVTDEGRDPGTVETKQSFMERDLRLEAPVSAVEDVTSDEESVCALGNAKVDNVFESAER
jgi:hypothetical protein